MLIHVWKPPAPSHLPKSLHVSGAEMPAPGEAQAAQSAPLPRRPPPAGSGPEQPSPPTADLEEALQVQYYEGQREGKNEARLGRWFNHLRHDRLVGQLKRDQLKIGKKKKNQSWCINSMCAKWRQVSLTKYGWNLGWIVILWLIMFNSLLLGIIWVNSLYD